MRWIIGLLALPYIVGVSLAVLYYVHVPILLALLGFMVGLTGSWLGNIAIYNRWYPNGPNLSRPKQKH